MTGLDDTVASFEARRSVWHTMESFEANSNAWQGGPLKAVQFSEVQEQVDRVGRFAAQALKSQKGDPVVLRLRDSVDSFRPLLPLMEVCFISNLTTRYFASAEMPVCMKPLLGKRNRFDLRLKMQSHHHFDDTFST